MMSDAALDIFNSLSTWRHLLALIDGGETEGLHLECKSHVHPILNRDMKVKLASALSGFSNSAGGVMLWGVATTHHKHQNQDIISDLEPIGNCASFEKQLRATIPTLTSPRLLTCKTKLIKKRPSDARGVVATYIPLTSGDPLMSNLDSVFYFRSGEQFVRAPHELVKRLFSATDVPDVRSEFTPKLVKRSPNGSWHIPILVSNSSSAFAQDVDVSVTIENPSACESIRAHGLQDNSRFNPGKKISMVALERGIHKGMPVVAGSLEVTMKTSKRSKRRLDIHITIYANRMRARATQYALSLAKSRFTVKTVSDGYVH